MYVGPSRMLHFLCNDGVIGACVEVAADDLRYLFRVLCSLFQKYVYLLFTCLL